MSFWMQIILAFVIGVLANKLWNVLLNTGYSVMVLKQLMDDSVKLMATTAQTIAEIHQIKYIEMHKAGKSEKGRLIVKNYIKAFPINYHNLLQFSDWDSAMDYVDELIKKEKHFRLR